MRFIEDGANVPDELIRSVSEGDVIFLCGAGVSKRAGLPLFADLTQQVYQEMGEAWKDEPAEKKALQAGEHDRVLRVLEKRTHRKGSLSLVRETVARLLAVEEDAYLGHHLSLVQLSRDRDGRTRLLTTNFDTLFERAARTASLEVRSHAVKALPKPGGPNDFGILHLHGRLQDTELGLDATELILTSADFGDAYLRDGWASQYIEDRMRLNVLVLVGYQAEDAALRLLLETLDADRERFRDLRKIYAIDRRTDGSEAIWKSKGIEPIEFADFPEIYETLAEWAKYAATPVDYRKKRITAILSKMAPQAKGRATP